MTTEQKPIVGDGYRLVEAGEELLPTDQVYLYSGWGTIHLPRETSCRVNVDGSSYPYGWYRRKLAQPDFRWIPVTEKLPPPYQTVCCTSDPLVVSGNASLMWSDFTEGGVKWLERPDRKPTHWCPLPPAPRPEPTREDRQVEAFVSAMGAGKDRYTAGEITWMGECVRKALAVT